MTPDETKLSATLHQKLGVVESAPIVARYHLGGRVIASFHEDKLVLTVERDGFGPFQVIEMTPQEFTKLQEFSQESGWQCD